MSDNEEECPPWDPHSTEEVLRLIADEEDAPCEVTEGTTEEEEKSWWKRFVEWVKTLPSKIKSSLFGLELDIDGEIKLEDILSVRKAYAWYQRSGSGKEIKCPTELKKGDHIAIKTKSSRVWWNHMIVTDVYSDGFDAVTPCKPSLIQEEVKLESDYLCVDYLGQYFRTSHRESEMTVSELPILWSSLRKVVQFDRKNGEFSREQVIERARSKIHPDGGWDVHNNSSEKLVTEILTADSSQKQTKAHNKMACGVGKLVIGASSLSLKNFTALLRLILKLVKSVVKRILRGGGLLQSVAVISKMIKVLQIIGLCIGPIIDTVVCVVQIWTKHQRLKNGEITDKEFYSYLAKKLAELACNLIFVVLSGLAMFLIPIPVVNFFVTVALSIIGFFVSKFVGWLSGKGFEYMWDTFHAPVTYL